MKPFATELEPKFFRFACCNCLMKPQNVFSFVIPELLRSQCTSKFDTGMRRLGFEENDFEQLLCV